METSCHHVRIIQLIGDWWLLSHENRTNQKKSQTQNFGKISPVEDFRLPIGNNILDSEYLPLVVYYVEKKVLEFVLFRRGSKPPLRNPLPSDLKDYLLQNEGTKFTLSQKGAEQLVKGE